MFPPARGPLYKGPSGMSLLVIVLLDDPPDGGGGGINDDWGWRKGGQTRRRRGDVHPVPCPALQGSCRALAGGAELVRVRATNPLNCL